MVTKQEKNHKELPYRLFAIFDIGSGSVGGAIVGFLEDRPAKILYSKREDLVFQEELDFARFVDSMQKTLNKVCSDISENGIKSINSRHPNLGKKIDGVSVVFSSPWYIAQTKGVGFKYKKAKKISRRFIRELMKKETDSLLESSQVLSSEKIEGQVEVLESGVANLKVNGYSISDIAGKMVSNISLSLYTSVISKLTLEKCKKVVEGFFHTDNIRFHTSGLVYQKIFKDLTPADDFMIIDMSAEISDLFYIDDDSLISMNSFPLGTNYFLRKLSKETGMDPAHTKSTFSLLKDDSAESGTREAVNMIVKEAKNNWQKLVVESLEKNSLMLPPQLYTLAHSPFDSIINDFSHDLIKEKTGSDQSYVESKSVQASLFSESVKVDNDIKTDIFIVMNAKFLNTPDINE